MPTWDARAAGRGLVCHGTKSLCVLDNKWTASNNFNFIFFSNEHVNRPSISNSPSLNKQLLKLANTLLKIFRDDQNVMPSTVNHTNIYWTLALAQVYNGEDSCWHKTWRLRERLLVLTQWLHQTISLWGVLASITTSMTDNFKYFILALLWC